MNWHMIISMLIVVVLKVIGMTLFLLHFSQIFGSSDSLVPTRSYGTGRTPHTTRSPSVSPACPKDWDFNLGRCFFLSITESPWNVGKDDCISKDSTLAIANTPEKLTFLQEIAGVEKYFIGLIYEAEKRWHWIDNSEFKGNVTNQNQNFNCATIGLTKAFDAASCDISYRWICEKTP